MTIEAEDLKPGVPSLCGRKSICLLAWLVSWVFSIHFMQINANARLLIQDLIALFFPFESYLSVF